MTDPVLVSKCAPGLWIANKTLAGDNLFFRVNDVTAVIRLSRLTPGNGDCDYFDFVLPDNELLEMEYQKVMTKLDSICSTIKELRDVGRNVLVQCDDGKNKSALVAGYYMTRTLGMPAEAVVQQLITAYFTQEQIAQEAEDKKRLIKIQCGETVPAQTETDRVQAEARRNLRALTNVSFQKMLRKK